MSHMNLDEVRQVLERLGFVRLPGDTGPYSDEVIAAAEKTLGVSLAEAHRHMLAAVGGRISFEVGFADIKGHDGLCLGTFFGLGGDSLDIRRQAKGYAGQVPKGWVPVGDDDQGHFYCLEPKGKVYRVVLEERFWIRPECPEDPPPNSTLIAESFEQFLTMLQLPLWARGN